MTTVDENAVPLEQDSAPQHHVESDAWDPYDVWLKRVKRPRELDPLIAFPVRTATTGESRPTRASRLRV
jgi:hypothetical protein